MNNGNTTSVFMAKPYHSPAVEEAILAVLRSGRLISGPRVAEFEAGLASYFDCKHVIAVSSGTAALHLALVAGGVKPGDEVITTPFTFASTVNAILYAGAVPVLADIDPRTFNIDPGDIERKITGRTTAIEPVHLYGQPVDVDKIEAIARKYNLLIIEDAAQAIGAEYRGRKIGNPGNTRNLVCFSTYATKNLHTGEGGFVTTGDDELADKLRAMRNIGQEGKYRYATLGYNYRMTEIQAVIGKEQVPLIDEFTERRISNAEFLTRALSNLQGITTPYVAPHVRHAFHQYTIVVNGKDAGISRDELMRTLKEAGIETAVHYPVPIYRQPYFRNTVAGCCENARVGKADYNHLQYEPCQYPVTESIVNEIMSLPVHPMLRPEELNHMTETIQGALRKK